MENKNNMKMTKAIINADNVHVKLFMIPLFYKSLRRNLQKIKREKNCLFHHTESFLCLNCLIYLFSLFLGQSSKCNICHRIYNHTLKCESTFYIL